MNAYDIFEEKVEELRKRGVPESDVYLQVHRMNLGLYQQYCDERARGIKSQWDLQVEKRAEALHNALPPVPSDAPENPAQAIVLEIAKSYVDSGRATTMLEALNLVHANYPKATAAASETAWRQARGGR